MTAAAHIFRLDAVSKRYGETIALDNINLSVDSNE